MSEYGYQHYLRKSTDTIYNPAWKSEASYFHLPNSADSAYHIQLADSLDSVREAQRLRFDVFSSEYAANFPRLDGLDADEFDTFCDHLIVRHCETAEVVGTYRMLLPKQAKKIGRYYSQSEFFMTRLQRQIPDLLELGRSCVHPDHRNGTVIMMLWSAIVRYMQHHGCSHVVGCASVSMRDGGHRAATLWDLFQSNMESMVDTLYEAFPKTPLPLDSISRDPVATVPPLIRGYLKIGAKVCGEPNWDPDFNSADFLMLLDISSINPRYARHFGIL